MHISYNEYILEKKPEIVRIFFEKTQHSKKASIREKGFTCPTGKAVNFAESLAYLALAPTSHILLESSTHDTLGDTHGSKIFSCQKYELRLI